MNFEREFLDSLLEEGLTPADEAGSVVLRQPPASKLANLFRIDVRDHALGLVTQQLGGRAREHPPGGSLLKQHPGRDSSAMKRRSCGWSEDFMLEVPTGATILVSAGPGQGTLARTSATDPIGKRTWFKSR